MKKQILIIWCLAFAAWANAQDKTAMKYAATITKEDAAVRLNILAADDMQGRETGRAGAQKAAAYIKSQFQDLGLKGPVNGSSYFQMLDLKERTIAQRNLWINGRPLKFLKDYYILPGTFNDTKADYKEFVFVGYGIASDKYDDLSATDLTGKVAIILTGEPIIDGKSLITGTTKMSDWTTSRTKKINAIKAKNPIAIITLSEDIERMQSYASYFDRPILILGKEDTKENTPNLYFSKQQIDDLMAATKKNIDDLKNKIKETAKPVTFGFFSDLKIDIQSTLNPLEAKNVLGFLEGADPILKKEILVVTAHYDHLGIGQDGDVYNGADDDGSGTTGVLEIAEAFSKAKKEGKGPKRSILFMTVVGEEKGLLGSEWYSENPVFPLKNTIADLNIDMIGRVGELYKGKADSANYIYVIGSDKLSSTLKEINEKANATYTNMTLDYKYDDPTDPNRFYYRSDHYNFAKHGIPIIFYFNGVHEDYHKKTDEVKKINFPLLAKRAQLVFFTAWDLANRADRPKVDRENDMPSDR
ncbi:M28 family peptidase [Pedobacter sp. SD-b]|uniref:M28 family peptidase n=1 Tax=Pedobacter segetis TaxID=2793069 RepID=A0ABS1BIM1_9SPHI|nr:M28 family peptidase [Pedobacter segetis]MBK0382720.1 M28 family peptidase [Pedobacter segetis]